MTTILADTFTASLGKLANAEQKQAKLAAFDLQADPARPGLKMHRIDKSRDPNFWSLRASQDLRIIVHKTGDSILLAYVGHHDEAYGWAERRKIEVHPTTGTLQIVEVREKIAEIAPTDRQSSFDLALETGVASGGGNVTNAARPAPDMGEPKARQPVRPAPKSRVAIFKSLDEAALLSIGVPTDWIADVRAASEDGFFELAGHLPPEAAEALLVFAASGNLPEPAGSRAEDEADPFKRPDTQRRFRVIDGAEELKAALDWPFEKWAVFLHPSQRAIADRHFSGPARIAGSAGTGKTVVALHRIVSALNSDPSSRVLLTTFSEPLANALGRKLAILTETRPALMERVTVASFVGAARQLHALATGREPKLAGDALVDQLLRRGAEEAGEAVADNFLQSEWRHVVDAWQIADLETYGAVPRMGRKTRLSATRRAALWPVFSSVRQELARHSLMTEASLFAAVTDHWSKRSEKPFDRIVVDEAQDLGVAELRMLAAIAPNKADALFFAGDLGQRIFQQPFSWKGLGIDVRGRSSTLRVNYRTSHQIRRSADRLLPPEIRDVDGLEDDRRGIVSVFEGVEPEIILAADEDEEAAAVANFLKARLEEGTPPAEIGLFVRDTVHKARAIAAAKAAGMALDVPNDAAPTIGTMHLAKGLEFRAVAVLGCDEDALPSAERLATVADEFELDEVMATERQLLYVACTRARDHLLVSGVSPGSFFIEEMTK